MEPYLSLFRVDEESGSLTNTDGIMGPPSEFLAEGKVIRWRNSTVYFVSYRLYARASLSYKYVLGVHMYEPWNRHTGGGRYSTDFVFFLSGSGDVIVGCMMGACASFSSGRKYSSIPLSGLRSTEAASFVVDA